MRLKQGVCYQNEEGWRYMDMFDAFPPHVRRALANSKHNICAACFTERWGNGERGVTAEELLRRFELAIDEDDPRYLEGWRYDR